MCNFAAHYICSYFHIYPYTHIDMYIYIYVYLFIFKDVHPHCKGVQLVYTGSNSSFFRPNLVSRGHHNYPLILRSRYPGRWWPDYSKSHGISSHGISCHLIPEYLAFTNKMNQVEMQQTWFRLITMHEIKTNITVLRYTMPEFTDIESKLQNNSLSYVLRPTQIRQLILYFIH